jgi:hypothetical protein
VACEPNGRQREAVAEEELYDDNGDAIGTREFFVDEGLVTSPTDGLLRNIALLTPEEIARVLDDRMIIEQARGMLMFIYAMSADDALELLRWRSQAADGGIRGLAERLAADLTGISRSGDVDIRSACDALLLTIADGVRRDA